MNKLETSPNYIYNMFIAKIKNFADDLKISPPEIHKCMLTIKIRSLIDRLKTSQSPNSNVIQFYYIHNFCIYINFFSH